MVARHAKHVMAGLAQPIEEGARVLELLGPRALGEIAADDNQVGFVGVDPFLNRLDQLGVVRAEVEVGQMDDSRHVASTHSPVSVHLARDGTALRQIGHGPTADNTGTREVSGPALR